MSNVSKLFSTMIKNDADTRDLEDLLLNSFSIFCHLAYFYGNILCFYSIKSLTLFFAFTDTGIRNLRTGGYKIFSKYMCNLLQV